MEIEKYNEQQLTGTKHTRCHKITLINGYKDRQLVVFDEEIVHQLGDGDVLTKPLGGMTVVVDHDKVVTGPGGETMTYGELYQWMAACYLQEALERDASQVVVEEDEPEEEGEPEE